MHERPRVPDFLIVGAMRSGTTSLAYWLRQHPSVFMAAEKEVHYFDVHYDRGASWYAEQFSTAARGQVCGEATPEYMFLPWARERLARDLPEARLVVTLRDPVERAWSHYCMLRERGRESLTFADALDAEAERLRDRSGWSRYGYVAKGLYTAQVQALFERFGRDRVLVLLFEREVVARPEDTFRRVCRFVGVESVHHALPEVGRKVNGAVHVRSTRVRDVARRLPKSVRDAIGRVNTRPSLQQPVPAQLRTRLERCFAEDRVELQALLGTSLPEWSPTRASPEVPRAE